MSLFFHHACLYEATCDRLAVRPSVYQKSRKISMQHEDLTETKAEADHLAAGNVLFSRQVCPR